MTGSVPAGEISTDPGPVNLPGAGQVTVSGTVPEPLMRVLSTSHPAGGNVRALAGLKVVAEQEDGAAWHDSLCGGRHAGRHIRAGGDGSRVGAGRAHGNGDGPAGGRV